MLMQNIRRSLTFDISFRDDYLTNIVTKCMVKKLILQI